MAVDRRRFVATLVTAGATGLAAGSAAPALAAAADGDPPSPLPAEPWDLSWLDTLKGKHKQVFDCANSDLTKGTPLVVVRNFLDAHKTVFGLEHPAIDTIVGIAVDAFPMNVGDAVWARYALGERWKIKEPGSDAWATRNVFLDAPAGAPGANMTVRAMQARGTLFWQCNNALNFVARQLATATQRTQDEVRADLLRGLNPGVRLVPAHTMAVGLVQERGCTYEKL